MSKRSPLTLVVTLWMTGLAYAQQPKFKVLAFYSEKVEMDHVLFARDALYYFKLLASQHQFTFDATTDWDHLNDRFLGNYQVIVWLNDSPATDAQRAAFEKYIHNGGAWLGFHVAGYNDRSSKWTWFRDFLGGPVFHSNNWPPMAAKVVVEDQSHPVTKRLPATYDAPVTEWYQWKPSPRMDKNVKVLVSLAQENYPLGVKTYLEKGDTPVVWTNTRYKMLYLNMGHGNKVLSNPDQNKMFADGLLWLAGQLKPNDPPVAWTDSQNNITNMNIGHGDKVLSDFMQNNMIANALFWLSKRKEGISRKNLPALRPGDYPELVQVPGGTFRMGSDGGGKDEAPAHSITLKKFSIAKTETTVAQWRVFCNATQRTMPDLPGWGWHENHPVVNVSWDDCVAYCHWLSDQTGRHYRLPTEAEWEFAAAGGAKSHGTAFSGAATIDSVGWYVATGYGTRPVATKKSNELGLFDMTGNVWEWVSDWYDAAYYSASPSDNPAGPANGTYKVYRGGAWSVPAPNCRISYRNVVPPSSSNFNRGFRIAAD